MALSGKYRVRALRAAFDDVDRLFDQARDKIELREHALKLRYWPGNLPINAPDDRPPIIDLNWSWIRSLPGQNVGELRIDDVIGGCDNLRIIFFVGDSSVKEPLPISWVLAVFQKKRDDFSKPQISVFRGRRKLVIERFYRNR